MSPETYRKVRLIIWLCSSLFLNVLNQNLGDFVRGILDEIGRCRHVLEVIRSCFMCLNRVWEAGKNLAGVLEELDGDCFSGQKSG